MGVQVTQRVVPTSRGDRTALVVTPVARVTLGRFRLKELRASYEGGVVDRAIVAQVRSNGGDCMVVFRARGPDASWGFDAGLSDDECTELGYRLVLDQLPAYRRLVAAGVFALVHVEFGPRECAAYQEGTARALAEFEARSVDEDTSEAEELALLQADRWILRHLTYFTELSFDDAMAHRFAHELPELESRLEHLRAMTSTLPRSAIE